MRRCRYLQNYMTEIKHFKLNFERLHHLKVMTKTPLSYLITFYGSLVHLKFTPNLKMSLTRLKINGI